MRRFDSKPSLRWLAPIAVVAVIGGSGLVAGTATADPALPPRTAKELLVDVQQAQVDALSGTVVQHADLGIPAIPGSSGSGTDLNSLVAGDHSLKVWYAGPDKARLQVFGRLGESDVILNGTDLWTWSSDQNAATHRKVDVAKQDRRDRLPADAPKTPQDAAERALQAVEPTTEVSTEREVTVAKRDAYLLVLTPKDDGSLISRVEIAVDGAKHVPLGVEAFAGDRSVFSVKYDSVDFARPDDAQFAWNPPPGAKVTQKPAITGDADHVHQADKARKRAAEAGKPSVVGKGWATVVVSRLDDDKDQRSGQVQQFLSSLPKVSGSWGSGRLLAGTAFTAVLTDDGRLAVGAVRPERVYDALAK